VGVGLMLLMRSSCLLQVCSRCGYGGLLMQCLTCYREDHVYCAETPQSKQARTDETRPTQTVVPESSVTEASPPLSSLPPSSSPPDDPMPAAAANDGLAVDEGSAASATLAHLVLAPLLVR
jgi:hypothetical protein